MTFTGVDYRGLLDRRWSTSNVNTTASPDEQFDIVWDWITETQATSGGDLGITQVSTWPPSGSGVARGDEWPVGTNIGQAITEMGLARGLNEDQGFDWDIHPDLTMELFTPVRGDVTNFAIE